MCNAGNAVDCFRLPDNCVIEPGSWAEFRRVAGRARKMLFSRACA
jgi:hypothetical protein